MSADPTRSIYVRFGVFADGEATIQSGDTAPVYGLSWSLEPNEACLATSVEGTEVARLIHLLSGVPGSGTPRFVRKHSGIDATCSTISTVAVPTGMTPASVRASMSYDQSGTLWVRGSDSGGQALWALSPASTWTRYPATGSLTTLPGFGSGSFGQAVDANGSAILLYWGVGTATSGPIRRYDPNTNTMSVVVVPNVAIPAWDGLGGSPTFTVVGCVGVGSDIYAICTHEGGGLPVGVRGGLFRFNSAGDVVAKLTGANLAGSGLALDVAGDLWIRPALDTLLRYSTSGALLETVTPLTSVGALSSISNGFPRRGPRRGPFPPPPGTGGALHVKDTTVHRASSGMSFQA